VTPEQTLLGEGLRKAAQELLDRWYPGTAVTVDCTGQAYLLQLTRGFRLAAPIWIPADRPTGPEDDIALRRELIETAWHLAADVGG